ncbi:MAG: membrane protein insertion efficiency factor YidD [Opitutales bacterium]
MKRKGSSHSVRNILAFPFISLIRTYQFISPLKQLILGPYARCRFHPTCSEYALECFRSFPLHKALGKTLSRIARCNPMHPGGVDHVPVPASVKSLLPKD